MKISTLAKYIDQPLIQHKLNRYMPALLIGGGGIFALHDTFKQKHDCIKNKDCKKEKHNHDKVPLKNVIIFATTALASYYGAKGLSIGGKKIWGNLLEITPKNEILEKQTQAISKYLNKIDIKDKSILEILKKVQLQALKISEIEHLEKNLADSAERKELFSSIFALPKVLTSKEAMGEIKRLSILGAIPVVSGIVGGYISDIIAHTKDKNSGANRIKEGFYQYFANIFLCNVGAALALVGAEQLEKMSIIKTLTPAKRLMAIFAGIIGMGVIGGSIIANYLGNKFIDPIFNKKSCQKQNGIYCERKPEALDIALHADDLATAGVLAGLKWIEPLLPFMYFISGYRAGTGYRNNENICCKISLDK